MSTARRTSSQLLVGAGVVCWAVAGLPRALTWFSGAPFDGRSLLFCAAYTTFAIAFLMAAGTPRFASARGTLLAAQGLAAVVVYALGPTGFEGVLLCVVAGEVPLVMSERAGLRWITAQVALMVLAALTRGATMRGNVFSVLSYAGFQLFAFGAGRFAAREAAARTELARVHAELLAKEELFADSARTAERLRIARELHDSLGHHLTALSLQLEIARNVAEGRAKEPVDRAHALTKELLGELRGVVSTMREGPTLDLAAALRTLAAGIPEPHVHLEVKGDLRVEPALAHTIFRCVQEALTNAVRHAGAANVYLTIDADGENVTVTARDDGHGAAEVRAGHGLAGLRERVEGMGGKLEIVSARGAGLTLRALVPARGTTT